MKISDDYTAKVRIWAASPQVRPIPKPLNLPRFRSKKFDSYDEMNAWKRQLLKEIAANGGVRWKK